jgi:hypothetical protein
MVESMNLPSGAATGVDTLLELLEEEDEDEEEEEEEEEAAVTAAAGVMLGIGCGVYVVLGEIGSGVRLLEEDVAAAAA